MHLGGNAPSRPGQFSVSAGTIMAKQFSKVVSNTRTGELIDSDIELLLCSSFREHTVSAA